MQDAPTPAETLVRFREVHRVVAPVVAAVKETHHRKIRFGKPTVITRKHERIIIERKPRDGREAVFVTIETLDNGTSETVS